MPDKRSGYFPEVVAMAAPKQLLLQAVDRALAGDWQAAHEIAQEHEDDDVANWIHAVVHWIEGDLSNARYWFRQAGRQMADYPGPEDTLRAIKAALEG
jgi:hypothetical protein